MTRFTILIALLLSTPAMATDITGVPRGRPLLWRAAGGGARPPSEQLEEASLESELRASRLLSF
jgi:hypothetical protein